MSYKSIVAAVCIVVAAVFPSCSVQEGFVLAEGDLVFCVAESCVRMSDPEVDSGMPAAAADGAGMSSAGEGGDAGMSSAVVAATAWDDSLKFDHVAMVVFRDGKPCILEATSSKGVSVTPWDDFLDLAADIDHEGGKGLVVMRVNREFPVEEAVRRAYGCLGQEYDWHFLPDNGKLYCSELIYECYRWEDGSPMFPSSPMNFRDAEGRLPQFWTELFAGLGEPVPEGVPGTNPNDMSKSDLLSRVCCLW